MTEYEFTDEENNLMEGLARKMVMLSVMTIFSTLLILISMILTGFTIVGILSSISMITFSIFLYLPVDNFGRIVEMEGHDVSEVIQGYRELNTGWTIFAALVALSILVILVEIFLY